MVGKRLQWAAFFFDFKPAVLVKDRNKALFAIEFDLVQPGSTAKATENMSALPATANSEKIAILVIR